MKKLLPFLLLALALHSRAQITITDNDLPQGGDRFLLSTGNPLSISANDLKQTGANQVWDFDIDFMSQQYDTAFKMDQTPLVFRVVFFGCDYADKLAPDVSFGSTFSASDIYSYYNLTSTKLEQKGIGANLNSIPTPTTYDPIDVIYRFPMNYGNEDSCEFAFSQSIPTIGKWMETGKRVNHVDGWGTLVTPFGNKEVLRIRSEVSYEDSVYVDFFSFGLKFPRKEVQYKWLAKEGGFPMLQVVTSVAFGNETVTQVLYQDTVNTTGIKLIESGNEFAVYPQPAINNCFVVSKTGEQVDEALIYDMTGRLVKKVTGNKQSFINISTSALSAGLYSVVLQCRDKKYSAKISVVH